MHIKIATPRDDVCGTCEKLRKAVQDAVLEEEKLDCANKQMEHVLTAQKEWNKMVFCGTSAQKGYFVPKTVN